MTIEDRLDESWPLEYTESISCCPYCSQKISNIEYSGLIDCTFGNAPGKWNYYKCQTCKSLYLNPRPNNEKIYLAYSKYYTHGLTNINSIVKLKNKIKNEIFFQVYGIKNNHRLFCDKTPLIFFIWMDKWINKFFGFVEIVSSPKGRLLDLGCGDGSSLEIAKKLGWDVIGIEIDGLAVECSKQKGLHAIEGDYRLLREYENYFNCIICSHVLEHLDRPIDALVGMFNSLKKGGMLILSLPNSESILQDFFKEHWRGLECPRHLSIPSLGCLKKILEKIGFNVTQKNSSKIYTLDESWEIMKKYKKITMMDRFKFMRLKFCRTGINSNKSDFIEFICIKK